MKIKTFFILYLILLSSIFPLQASSGKKSEKYPGNVCVHIKGGSVVSGSFSVAVTELDGVKSITHPSSLITILHTRCLPMSTYWKNKKKVEVILDVSMRQKVSCGLLTGDEVSGKIKKEVKFCASGSPTSIHCKRC